MPPKWVRYIAGLSAAVAFSGIYFSTMYQIAGFVALGISGAINAFLASAGFSNGAPAGPT